MNILIIHPEGNINNNPNLSGIAEILSENNYTVDILSPKNKNIYQKEFSYNLILLEKFDYLYSIFETKKKHFLIKPARKFSIFLLRKILQKYSFIIGVDGEGIILASIFSDISDIPYALINYEIFFLDETDLESKNREIDACGNIKFAICQDSIRSEKLSEENKIDIQKIIKIPTAGKSLPKIYDTDYLRKKYNLNEDIKIALYMGSLGDWCCNDLIFNDIKDWPEDWVLALHGRYKNDKYLKKIQEKYSAFDSKIFYSTEPFESFDELMKLPASADVGIALYRPTFTNRYTGKNLQYIGWSSGKISTYLQCGLPVIVNNWGIISESVKDNKLGFVLKQNQKISDILNRTNAEELKKFHENCIIFFKNKLDLSNYEQKILHLFNTHKNDSIESKFHLTFFHLNFILNLISFGAKLLIKFDDNLKKQPGTLN